ncbi:MAG: DegV family protein [Anaerolineaceae bacterium]|nr:DegV family protein [Anaerolineaceae bacterium]MBN2676834.1 DegV family protein [Anaerolineaceae bacterium]
MTIRIVADSTCDLPEFLAQKYGIAVIPTCINIGNKTYLDGIDMTREQFYEGLPSFPSIARTSAPGPDAFIRTYERLVGEGASQIISIHPPANLSNLFNVAQLAADAIRKVRVVPLDLGQVTLGSGLLAVMAARAAEAGDTLDAIVKRLISRASKTYTFAAMETLDYLKRSGRIPGLVANIGSLLNIKPVVTLTNGAISITKVRTTRSATEHLICMIKNLGPLEELSIVHAHARARAEGLLKLLEEALPRGKETLLVEATPILGVHVGLGAVGVVAVKK